MYRRAAAPREHLALLPSHWDIRKQRHTYRKTSGSEASPIHSGVADFCLAATPALTHSQPRVHHRLHGQRHPARLKRQVQLLSITLLEGAQAVTSTWQKPHLLCFPEWMWPLRQSCHKNNSHPGLWVQGVPEPFTGKDGSGDNSCIRCSQDLPTLRAQL